MDRANTTNVQKVYVVPVSLLYSCPGMWVSPCYAFVVFSNTGPSKPGASVTAPIRHIVDGVSEDANGHQVHCKGVSHNFF
jgi:hypothetical protein